MYTEFPVVFGGCAVEWKHVKFDHNENCRPNAFFGVGLISGKNGEHFCFVSFTYDTV